jgi:hypothetical protein
MADVSVVTTYNPLFGSLGIDFIIILALGAIGGIVFALLMEKGIGVPGKVYTNGKLTLLNFGVFADLIIGSIAAAVTFALNPQMTIFSFFVIGITAGIGGKAILTGYIKGKDLNDQLTMKAKLAENYRAALQRHAGKSLATETMNQLSAELDEIDKEYL